MQTAELYKKYNLMPQLIKHQLRVAGVVKLISDSWDERAVAEKAIRACLLHDMGNMAKFSGLTEPYWQEEQERFWAKYGHDAHVATKAILAEMGLSEYIEILEEEGAYYGDSMVVKPFTEASRPALMVLYGDLRVDLTGVVSLYERIKDLITRYPNSKRPETMWGAELEHYVQILTPVKLSEITEAKVAVYFPQLLLLEWD